MINYYKKFKKIMIKILIKTVKFLNKMRRFNY